MQVGKECVVLPLLHLMSDDAFACGQYILGNVIAVTIFSDNIISCQNCWHCLENPSCIQGLYFLTNHLQKCLRSRTDIFLILWANYSCGQGTKMTECTHCKTWHHVELYVAVLTKYLSLKTHDNASS